MFKKHNIQLQESSAYKKRFRANSIAEGKATKKFPFLQPLYFVEISFIFLLGKKSQEKEGGEAWNNEGNTKS